MAKRRVPGMGLSYILLLTAFYMDNGPHLPLLAFAIAFGTLAPSEHRWYSYSDMGSHPSSTVRSFR